MSFFTLNEAQYQAVTHETGPLLVSAGPGTGKTCVLTHRLRYLLDQGVRPESILLLTFTRRAAQDMLRRVANLSNRSSNVEGGTFHAVGSRILRRYGRHIGLHPDFVVIDRSDAADILNALRPPCPPKLKSPEAVTILNIFSVAVNKSIPVFDFVRQHPRFFEFAAYFSEIEQAFAEYKLSNHLMDYDDLLVFWRRLLLEPASVEKITRFYQHILVDEYQDTNFLQAEIVRLMSSFHNNVMAVGDEAQSIYSFRGADADTFFRFREQFPSAVEIFLEQNYRSLSPVLDIANSVIPKNLFTSVSGGNLPFIYPAYDEEDEARFVVSNIRKLFEQGIDLSEIAVLYRDVRSSHSIELQLLAQGIPFEKRGGMKLAADYARDIFSFFRVKANPHDRLAWQRIFKQIDRIGDKTAFRLSEAICSQANPFDQLRFVNPLPSWRIAFNQLVTICKELHKCNDLAMFSDLVISYYEPIFSRKNLDNLHDFRQFAENLRDFAASYSNFSYFVEDYALDPVASPSSPLDRLILSTTHSGKGLEFKVVFVVGLVEGRFPARCCSPAQREEERRLFYVAVTRAREQLFLTWPSIVQEVDRTFSSAVMSPFLRVPSTLFRTATIPF